MTDLQKISTYITKEEKIRLRTIAASQDWGMSELLKAMINICLDQMNEYSDIGQYFQNNGQ